MKTINISKKIFDNLRPLELSDKIKCSEAKIFDFRYRNHDKVLKKLYNNKGGVFANKLYTVEMLDTYKELFPDTLVVT